MDTLGFLSDSSTDSSTAQSDNEENLAAQTLQAAFQEQIAQKANAFKAQPQENNEFPKSSPSSTIFTSISSVKSDNNNSITVATNSNMVTTSSILPLTKPKKVKKRPPAPDDFSKLLGIPINEAPKKKIKKLSDVSSKSLEKRAKELEDKYSWCFEESSAPVHRAVQNPYDIDAIECLDSTTEHQPATALPRNNHKPCVSDANVSEQSMSKSLRIGKMVAADWASSVAPPTEDLFSEQIESRDQNYQTNSYDFNKAKTGYHRRVNNRHHNNRSSMDKQRSHHDKRHPRPSHHPRLNHTSTQCPSPNQTPPMDVSTQTQPSNSQSTHPPEAEKLNKPDYYKAKADGMKKILSLMSDPVSTLIVRLKLSLLEMQEVVAMLAYRLDTNAVCHRINIIISACRKNLEEIKNFKENNVILRDALTVITMKLMSFLYHHLYLVRREEVAKAKLTLESFIMRSESREMAERELSGLKTYVMHMEYFGKSFNYLERANIVIKNHKSEYFSRHNFKELYPMNNIFRHVSVISPALIEANRIHDEQL